MFFEGPLIKFELNYWTHLSRITRQLGVRLMNGFMPRFKSHLIELDGHFVIVEVKFTWPRKAERPEKQTKISPGPARPINQVAFARPAVAGRKCVIKINYLAFLTPTPNPFRGPEPGAGSWKLGAGALVALGSSLAISHTPCFELCFF